MHKKLIDNIMGFQRNHLASGYNLLSVVLICLIMSCDSESNKAIVDLNDRVSDKELKAQEQQVQNHSALYFGFDLRASPQEDSRQYLPFLRYLEKSTGYKFELRFTPKNSSIIDELGTGKVHFGAVGAVSYIQGHEKYGIIGLALGLNQTDKAKYQSMIVTSPNSSIKRVEDVKNKRFAFGSIDSTQGHLIPRILLRNHGIGLDDLASYKYTGSHQNCAEAVVSFKFDACGMQDTMAKEMQKQGLVKIIHESSYYPSSGIAANQNVSPEIISKVKKALLSFEPNGKDKESLYHWSKTEMPNGFISAEKEDYIEMRKWLIEFHLLDPLSISSSVN